MQEQFQQQLHEQQQKIQLLQAVVEKQKAQIEKKEEPELPNIPLDQLGQEGMSHDAIKMAFRKLQVQSTSGVFRVLCDLRDTNVVSLSKSSDVA